MNRTVRYMLVIGIGIISILLFLLSSASENSNLFDQHYPLLLGLNTAVTFILLGFVIWLLIRLLRDYRRKRFGHKLLARLVFLFGLIGILPGVAIYLVSMQFVSHSIESWFNVKTEAALESGITLSKNALDSSLNDLFNRAKGMAQELSDLSDAGRLNYINHLRDPNIEISIVNGSGQIITSAGTNFNSLIPQPPSSHMLKQAKMTRGFSAVESDDLSMDNSTDWNTNLRLHVVVMIPQPAQTNILNTDTLFLQILQPVPEYLAHNADTLRQTYTDYQQRFASRTGLRKIYLVTLTLTLLLAIFSALACAFFISRALAKPLLLLAAGTKAVAEGNLSPKPIVSTNDELGTLTQSFNTMTKQLLDARIAVDNNREQLEHAKAYLESILANMSAGVIVLDKDFKVVSSNDSVTRILNYDFNQDVGHTINTIPTQEFFAEVIIKAFAEQRAQMNNHDQTTTNIHWQQQVEFPLPAELTNHYENEGLILLMRGSQLPVEDGIGYIIVFDNITDVISAQRAAAWGEVVRRLAHEIKNPLTPIQLSAERLQMRLENKLEPADAAILNKSTTTIVNQVASMKNMVDDFRNYAKLPPAKLEPLNLNELIAEILHLYVSGSDHDMIHQHLSPDLPQILGDATQLRQVLHNLLQNAQDAVLDSKNPAPHIDVSTETVPYQGANGIVSTAVRLSITDNGPGFSSKLLARAFEPYITTKPRGTGLGLPMVKKIIEEHGGRIDLQNRTESQGAKILILLTKLAS